PLAGPVSCLLLDQPRRHRTIRHSVPRRAGASCRRALPYPHVNAHPWVYGTLDALRWTADAGFRLSVGISPALRWSKLENRNSKLGSWAPNFEFQISSFVFLVDRARPRRCFDYSEFHPRSVVGL